MKRTQALAAAADLFRRYRSWNDDANRCGAQERPGLRKSAKALERSSACSIYVAVDAPFGTMHRIEASGETVTNTIESLKSRGLIELRDRPPVQWVITAAGRAALFEATGEHG